MELIEVHERRATREEPPKRSKAIENQIVAIDVLRDGGTATAKIFPS